MLFLILSNMLNNINGIKVTSPGFNIAVLLNFFILVGNTLSCVDISVELYDKDPCYQQQNNTV